MLHPFNETDTTPAQLRARLLGDGSVARAQVVQHAIERGEVAAALPPRVVSLPGDLLRHEFIMNLSRVPEATIVDIVDTVSSRSPLGHDDRPQERPPCHPSTMSGDEAGVTGITLRERGPTP